MGFKWTATSTGQLESTSNVTVQSIGTGAVSVAAWVRATSVASTCIFGHTIGIAGYSKQFQGYLTDSTGVYHQQVVGVNSDGGSVRQDSYKQAGTPDFPDQWDHYIWIFPSLAGPELIYRNGSALSTTADASSTPTGFTPASLKWRVATANVTGLVAEWGIWNVQLTTDDIDKLAGTNNGGNNASLVRYAPGAVHTASLQHYWSLKSTDANTGLNDQKGSATLTATTATSDSDHPSGITAASSAILLIHSSTSGGMQELSGGMNG